LLHVLVEEKENVLFHYQNPHTQVRRVGRPGIEPAAS
jgi:hypothetical protein